MYPLSNQAMRRPVWTHLSLRRQRACQQPPEELQLWNLPSSAQWALCNLSLWHDRNVKHSDDELKRGTFTKDRQGLLELVVLIHKDVNRLDHGNAAQYFYPALGWR